MPKDLYFAIEYYEALADYIRIKNIQNNTNI